MTTSPKSSALRAFLDRMAEQAEEERSICDFMTTQLRRNVPGGRPRLELPPVAACAILDALEDGYSKKEVAKVFGEHYKFGLTWLKNALKDGRLDAWAQSYRCPRHDEEAQT